jgi:glycosyltransferase involved in cell wall biosynthesis
VRIGLLTTGYPRTRSDHCGLFVRGFAKSLRSRGHSVEVLAPSDAALTKPETFVPIRYAPRVWERTFYRDGVPDNVSDVRAWPGLLTFPLSLALSVRKRARRWDAVVAHFGIPCGLVAQLSGLPVLTVWHSGDVHLVRRLQERAPWLRHVLRQTLFDRGAHWFVREEHRAALMHGAQASSVVQPMPADVHAVDHEAARAALGLSRPTVLFLGRLVPVKGVEVLLDAMAGFGEADLVFAGDGPLRAMVRDAVLRSEGRIRALGWVAEPAKSQWLAAADVVVVPSIRLPSGRTEGSPVVVREAQCVGTPVVVSDVVPVDGDDGTVFPAGDTRALRAAIRFALADPRPTRDAPSLDSWSDVGARAEQTLLALRGATLADLGPS